MTYILFREWGLQDTADFGEIVFHLVEAGRLGKTDTDSKDDFKDIFSFEDAFIKPFEPQQKQKRAKRKTAATPSDDLPF